MSSFEKERFSLDDIMKILEAKWTGNPHITYDPSLVPQYRIIRQQSHDGTQIFTLDLIRDSMMHLFTMNSYYKPMGLPPEDCYVQYTVGTIRLVTVYGTVDIPAGRYPGQRERIIIPVTCEYRKKPK